MSGDGSGGTGLPAAWQLTVLGELLTKIEAGSSFRCTERPPTEGEVGVAKVSAVTWGEYDEAESKTCFDPERIESQYMIRLGDFLFSRANTIELVGACVIVGEVRRRVMLSDKLLRFDFTSVDPSFVLWLLRSPHGRKEIECLASGNQHGMRNIGQEKIRMIRIPLPPLAEQKRIVAKLYELLARSRATRESLTATLPLLERYRESVLAAAFRGELTLEWRPESGISTSWANVSLGEVLKDVRYGTSKKCAYEPIDVPVLRIPNVVGGFVSRRDLKYAAFDEAEKRQLGLRDGDVLMIRSNGSLGLVGRTAVTTEADEGSLYAGYLIRLRADRERCNPRYLSLYLGAPVARARIENTARSTSGVNNINAEEIRGFPLPLPPLPEQHEIVRRVDAAFARIAAVRQLVEAQLARLDALDRSILARAFRGELVPQDPSDEPAAALLDRIRAERAAAPAKKPARRGRPAAV